MHRITGLLGRDELVQQVVREIRKGKHLVLAGPVGIGKSAVLEAALRHIEPRFDPAEPSAAGLVYLTDHQAKGQFVEMTRQLLAMGLLPAAALQTAKQAEDETSPEWSKLRRQVTRLGIRDLTAAIIPALDAHPGRVLIAVDDMTRLTPTQQAFWLAVFEQAQVVTCASERKQGLRKLWWKLKVIEVPPLAPEAARAIVQAYIARRGLLIEAPALYVSHVIKQAGGNPQAIADMLDESSKERVVNKRQIREMKHQAGIRYFDFTPVMIMAGMLMVGMRYVARGLDDMGLYILAGLGATLFLALRLLLFRLSGKDG